MACQMQDDDNFALASAEVTRHRAARRIVSDVLDIEADSQSYASRAKDRRLMDDITSRLVSYYLHQPLHSVELIDSRKLH